MCNEKGSLFSRLGWSVLVAGSLSFVAVLWGCGKEDAPLVGQDSPAVSELDDQTPLAEEGGDPLEGPEEALGTDDAVAIQVNDRVVTKEEFEEDLQNQVTRLHQQLGDVEPAPELQQRLDMIRGQMKQQLVEQTVVRMLLEDYIARSDLEVTEEEIDGEWEQIAAQFPDADMFEAMLQEEGLTVPEAREQVAQQVKLEKLMAQEFDQEEVTDADAEAFYDLRPEQFAQPAQVRARHILLRDKEGAEEAIHELHERIEEGEDFAELAAEFSDCPSGKQGGDLGFFGEGQMVEPFSRQAFAMNAGEVSAPIRTEFGHHIIKVEEFREAKQAEFAEVQETIKEHLGQQRAQLQQEEFVERLRDAATITINVDLPESEPFAVP